MSELPDWLKTGGGSGEPEQPSLQTTAFATPSSPFAVSPSSTTDRQVVTSSSNTFPPPVSPSPLLVEDDGKSPSRSWMRKLGSGFLYLISFKFLALLVYAVIVQLDDDEDLLLWTLYYSGHAALTFLFILTRLCRLQNGSLGGILLVLSIGMLAFTGIMLWFSIVDYQDARSLTDGEEGEKKEEEEEAFFDVCGAAFGGLSVLYHLMVWFCTTKTGKKPETDNTEDTNDI